MGNVQIINLIDQHTPPDKSSNGKRSNTVGLVFPSNPITDTVEIRTYYTEQTTDLQHNLREKAWEQSNYLAEHIVEQSNLHPKT